MTRKDSVAILAPKPEGIICDKDRAFKVAYISHHIYSEQIPIIEFDFQRTAKEKVMIIAGTMKDLVAVHSPKVEEYFLNQRKHEIGLIA